MDGSAAKFESGMPIANSMAIRPGESAYFLLG